MAGHLCERRQMRTPQAPPKAPGALPPKRVDYGREDAKKLTEEDRRYREREEKLRAMAAAMERERDEAALLRAA